MQLQKTLKSLLSLLKWEKSFLVMVVSVTFPILMQSLVSQSLNLIDNVMVSQLGDAAYAGVSQANRFGMVVYVMLFGVATGAGIFMAQYWGAQQIDNMKKANGMCITWGLAISLGLLLFVQLKIDFIVSLFLAPGESAEFAKQYLVTVSPMFPIFAISNAYGTLLKSEEKTKYPMIAGIVSMVLNTIINYLLIGGNFGFPRLGVVGAAIATVIASVVGLLVTLYFAFTKSVAGKASLKELFGFNKFFINNFNKTVSPVILNETLWSMGTAVFGIFYGMRGDIAVAAIGVFNTIDGLVFISFYALVGATSIIVGKALGSNDKEKAVLYAKRLSLGTILMAVVTSMLLLIAMKPLMSIFGNLSQITLDMAMKIIVISVMFSWIRSFNAILIVGILRAGGDTIASLVIDIVFLWFVAIPILGLATKFTDLPIHILYLFTLTDEILKFIFGMRRFRSGKWAKNLTNNQNYSEV